MCFDNIEIKEKKEITNDSQDPDLSLRLNA